MERRSGHTTWEEQILPAGEINPEYLVKKLRAVCPDEFKVAVCCSSSPEDGNERMRLTILTRLYMTFTASELPGIYLSYVSHRQTPPYEMS